MLAKGLIVGWLIWGLGALALAQSPYLGSPVTTSYGPDQYKAHNQNWAAVQDRRGVMYFGNTMGIVEYDGQHWQMVAVPGAAAVRALALGPDGTIYYGAVGDFGYLAVSPAGKVAAVSLKGDLPASEAFFSDVWQVESCADGIYFLTRQRFFRLKGGRITGVPGALAPSQACVLNGTLFYLDQTKGVCLVDGDEVVPIPALAGLVDGQRLVLAPFGPHELLVGRLSGGFRRVDLAPLWSETARKYQPDYPAKGLVKAFPTEADDLVKETQGQLYRLAPIGSQAFALGLRKAGVLIMDRSGRIIRALNTDVGLVDNTVNGLWVDASEDLWVTTAKGLSHVELSVPQSVFDSRNGIEGLPLSVQFHQGRLYVGTFQGLFIERPYRFSFKENRPRFEEVKNGPNQVWQFLEVEGDLLAASARGLQRIQGEAAVRIAGSSGGGLCLGTSRRWPGRLFMGSQSGLEVFGREGGQWRRQGAFPEIRDSIYRITEDANGDLWLSTLVHGLLRLRFQGSHPTEATIQIFGPADGLPGNTGLRTAYLDGVLYALTPMGLFRAERQKAEGAASEVTRFVPDPVIGPVLDEPHRELYGMTSDGHAGYLFNTENGVVWAVPEKKGGFSAVTRPFEGLSTATDRVYVHPDGAFWITGSTVQRVDPRAWKDYQVPFQVLIRKVISKDKRLLFEGAHGQENPTLRHQRTAFRSGPDSSEWLELPFRDNGLSFDYSATFFERPGTTRFQVLLEGFDKDWSEWSSGTFKEYTNLPVGHYRFRVRARNLYGMLGQEAQFRIRVLAPWYRTLWAYLAWAVLGAGSLAGLGYAYTLRLQRQKRVLKSLVASRTSELQRVNDRLYRLNDEKNRILGVAAHDLRNPLTGILLACELMDEEPSQEKALHFSAQVRAQGRRMLELIQGLLDVNAIETDTADLPNLDSLDPIPAIESACKAHSTHAQRKSIDLECRLGASGQMVRGDARHFERVMDNLISNAVKYSPAGSRILITRAEEPGHSVFRVQDEGPGLTAEDQAQLFQTYARLSARPTGGESSVGLGLSIVKRLTESMGGEVWAESEPGRGTTFCVRLPHGCSGSARSF
ncbi:sensor histidine kinase [Geothrix sp. PMB-07]|uniref:sensor histidine kinase n=1 Tax=Geothrix sp. PMB-07 TaxID=3068640 RepID=UPI00274113FA|nr:sensor histidine kinase [Geothrix sp. PMB-07]WLT31395.1 ATP-binding protein [Geothrix sp. PMB-07]